MPALLAESLVADYAGIVQDTLYECVNTHRPDSLLDVGTFRGDFLRTVLLHPHAPSRLVGIDFSNVPLKAARILTKRLMYEKELHASVEFAQANVLKLPFGPHHFDLVTSHGCLIHQTPDQIEVAAKELLRVSPLLFLVESSDPTLSDARFPHPDRQKRYWDVRSHYYTVDMMKPHLKKAMEFTPYYWSHDYPKIFTSLGAKIKTIPVEGYASIHIVKGGKHG